MTRVAYPEQRRGAAYCHRKHDAMLIKEAVSVRHSSSAVIFCSSPVPINRLHRKLKSLKFLLGGLEPKNQNQMTQFLSC